MKKAIMLGLLIGIVAQSLPAQVSVRGYVRKDGTYVQSHYRSKPESSTLNNWSARGNVNPHTGEIGRVGAASSAWLVPQAPLSTTMTTTTLEPLPRAPYENDYQRLIRPVVSARSRMEVLTGSGFGFVPGSNAGK